VHGLVAGVLGTLGAGASAVLAAPFDPGVVLAHAAGDATLFFGVPTMYHRLAAHPEAAALARLRLAVSGSAPLPPSLAVALAEGAGVRVLERYGMTETLLTVSNPLVGERRPGSIGLPLPGVRVRVAGAGDPDDSVDEGELWVRGPSVFAGYWERPAATADAFTEGWFRTGDAVRRAPDGYLSVQGRRGDLIISGGFNVYPAEVEDVLSGHPGVAEVAVVGVASDEWGEEVTAFVVPAGTGLNLDELRERAASSLAPYKRPRRIAVVEQLPRNAMGKILRQQLREGS
jgi:acyl-CoA synthetase (AMP-forming)/AMP-acid ligase II